MPAGVIFDGIRAGSASSLRLSSRAVSSSCGRSRGQFCSSLKAGLRWQRAVAGYPPVLRDFGGVCARRAGLSLCCCVKIEIGAGSGQCGYRDRGAIALEFGQALFQSLAGVFSTQPRIDPTAEFFELAFRAVAD